MKSPAPPPADPTSARILDVAERLVQTRGFNAFSYADIALEVGVSKASLHYHFATKAELGRRLIARYSEQFTQALRGISERLPAAPARLRAYVKLYTDVLSNERMCLCGMLAAEYSTLPAAMQGALRTFFELNETWLTELLEAGRHDGTLSLRGPSKDAARMLVGALEGEMLVARAYGDPARFIAAAELLVAPLDAGGERARSGPRARSARATPPLRSARPPRSARQGRALRR